MEDYMKINPVNFMRNYSKRKRNISPEITTESSKANNYYCTEETSSKNKNMYMSDKLSASQYNYGTNSINYYPQQNQQYPEYSLLYNDSNDYYPSPFQKSGYYEEMLPEYNNKIIIRGKDNGCFSYDKRFKNMKNMVNLNRRQIEQMKQENTTENTPGKNKSNKYKNGVNLNIANCTTEYPINFSECNK